MSDQLQQGRMALLTDSATIFIHFEHVLVIDMHGKKIRVGELRLAMLTFGIDLFEGRIGLRWKWLFAVVVGFIRLLLLLIEMLTKMSD